MSTQLIASTNANETLGSLFFMGAAIELDYLTPEAADAARALEAELLADAAAGVDLRIRLIGRAASA